MDKETFDKIDIEIENKCREIELVNKIIKYGNKCC